MLDGILNCLPCTALFSLDTAQNEIGTVNHFTVMDLDRRLGMCLRLLAVGICLSANEVPRIAQMFGLDTSVRVNIARLRTKGFMDEGKYQEQSKELNNKIRKLQAELKKITRSDDEDDVLEQLDMLVDYFEKREHMMVSFEPETFDSMADKITANQNELTFHLLGGIELKEKI